MNARDLIRQNIEAHDRFAARYEKRHPEIFNPIEQARLAATLAEAIAACDSPNRPLRALDIGCGTGNLTRHLVELGCHVTAADISPAFLEMISAKFNSEAVVTHRLNGEDLREIASGTFDLVAAYSVLHHIPDYLHAVQEMARVTRMGGVVYIDHEVNEQYWNPSADLAEFRALVKPPTAPAPTASRFLNPKTYVRKLRDLMDTEKREARRQLRINPRWIAEGDIHIWPDDHIEWHRIESTLTACGFEALFRRDFLHADARYPSDIYERYKSRCTDMRVLAMKRIAT